MRRGAPVGVGGTGTTHLTTWPYLLSASLLNPLVPHKPVCPRCISVVKTINSITLELPIFKQKYWENGWARQIDNLS